MGGSAGSTPAGSTPPGALEECEQYCKTLYYRLPQALCEDWHRTGWQPQFCHLPYSDDCSDYCTTIYNGVSPACAATLPAAIRCVAPDYQRQGVPTQCWLEECRDPLFTMTAACYGLREQLDAARAAWSARGLVDYQLSYNGGDGKAVVAVRGGAQPTVTPAGATPWTVPQLFDEVERLLATPGVAPGATYDAALGYVTQLESNQVCDFSVIVSGIEVAPPP